VARRAETLAIGIEAYIYLSVGDDGDLAADGDQSPAGIKPGFGR